MQRSCSETLNKILHMFFQLRRPTTQWQNRVIQTGSSVSFLWIFLQGILESVGGFCFLGLDDCYDWGFVSWWNYNNAPCFFFFKKHVLCKAHPPNRGVHYQLRFDVLRICLVGEVILLQRRMQHVADVIGWSKASFSKNVENIQYMCAGVFSSSFFLHHTESAPFRSASQGIRS